MPFRKVLSAPTGSDRFSLIERRFLRTLLIGFGMVLVAMVASGWFGLRLMKRIGAETELLSEQNLRETSLIDKMLRHQGNLGVLLYSMAEKKQDLELETLSPALHAQREQILANVKEALARGPGEPERIAWREVESSARNLFAETDKLIALRRSNSSELSSLHRAFIAATARLADISFGAVAAARATQLQSSAASMTSAQNLFLMALALAALCAAGCVAVSFAIFHSLEKGADYLAKLSIHTLSAQEETARRFSQDMHDEFGQALNAIESTLLVVQTHDPNSKEHLQDAIHLVKEAQASAREMSHLLRPRILDDFGLDAGLRELANGYSKRTGIVVDYRSNTQERLHPNVETQLFRIAQEALTNTSRHSMAKVVDISLLRTNGNIQLSVSDDGGGFPVAPSSLGLGLLGMKERARAAGGTLTVSSQPGKGVEIRAEIPIASQPHATGATA
ncbi:MAG: sensor histidine kinase [Bryobacterales bacterium]|nr:sensor histidine kinase [Bryobacterales bacterium]